MNKLLTAAFLAAILGQGCIFYGNGNNDGPAPGDVTFLWSFYGKDCEDVPGVTTVKVTIPGEDLEFDGEYGCLNGGYPGITLHDFAGGNYSYTLEGISSAGTVLYRASGTFLIDGDESLDVDLTPVGEETSYAFLSWAFPANWASTNPGCTDATVRYVDVDIDDSGNWERYDCTAGQGASAARSILLPPGEHHVELVAVHVSGDSEYAVAFAEGTITTTAFAPADYAFTLAWEIGGTTIAWQLKDGGTNQTCEQAKVQTVYVHFRDVATGEEIDFGTVAGGDDNPCNVSTVTYRYLRPGTYEVGVTATATDDVEYASASTGAPRITVTAGAWTPDSPPVITIQTPRL